MNLLFVPALIFCSSERIQTCPSFAFQIRVPKIPTHWLTSANAPVRQLS